MFDNAVVLRATMADSQCVNQEVASQNIRKKVVNNEGNSKEVPKNKLSTKKSRAEYEEGSNSGGNRLQSEIIVQLTKLTTVAEKVHELLKKMVEERTSSESDAWDAIREVPNLAEEIRINAFKLLDTQPKKDGFLKMTLEEREKWMLMMSKK